MELFGVNPRELPVVGDYIARIGKVYRIVSLPCSTTPELWVLAFWHGVPTVLWSLFQPDPVDDVYDRMGGRHTTKRRGRFIRRASTVADPPWPKGLGWAKFTADLAQRFGWWLLIADVATEFAVHWTSEAYFFAGCKVPGSPYVIRSEEEVLLTDTPVWKQVDVTTDDAWIFSGGSYSAHVPAGYSATIGVSCTVTPQGGWQGSLAGSRIREVQTGRIVEQIEAPAPDDQGRQAVRHITRDWRLGQPERDYIWEVLPTGDGFVWLNDCSLRAIGAKAGDDSLLPWFF